jgi:hypothetical protein
MCHILSCAERSTVTKVKWFAMKLGSTPSRQKVTFMSDSRLPMPIVSVPDAVSIPSIAGQP